MINSYNTSAVHQMVFAFFRALNEGFVPQRPASRPVPLFIMKDFPGYEGLYGVTEDGRMWSYRESIFMGYSCTYGYAHISLHKDGKRKTTRVHKIVDLTHIPNPNKYKVVRHLDNNRLNNHVSNLEWCTQKTNIQQCWREGRHPVTQKNRETSSKNGLGLGKPVMQFTNEGVFCKEYSSTSEAARINGISQSCISKCARGISKSVGGYIWKYSTVNQLIKANKK